MPRTVFANLPPAFVVPDAGVTDVKVAAGAAIAESKLALTAGDQAVGTASRRTLGTGALQAAAGNDSRFGSLPPTNTIIDSMVAGNAGILETKLALASDAAAGTASRRTLGTGALQAAAGNDSRFGTGTVADGSITIAKLAATGSPSATTYLRGDNTWGTPASAGGVTTVAGRSGAVVLAEADVANLTTDLASHLASINTNTAAVAARLVSANNLSDLASAATARTNLGLSAAATAGLIAANNLSDLASVATGRTNLGLGAAAVAAIGTAAGTVAAGNDSRFAASPITSVAGRTGAIVLAEADITSLVTDLSGKASSVHQHSSLTLGSAGLGPADYGFKAWTFDATSTRIGSVMPTAGQVLALKFLVPGLTGTTSITNLYYHVATAGVTLTTGQCFLAIYDASGTLVANSQTSDQAANMAGTGMKTAPTGGTITLTNGAYYYAAIWFNGTTGPNVLAGASAPANLNGLLVGAAAWLSTGANGTGITTTAPATLGAQTANSAARYWIALA